MNERRNNMSESHEESFQRIFEPDEYGRASGFVEWLESPDEPLFWIRGKPGSGKSTLMKFLPQDERTWRNLNTVHSSWLLISHFFWMAAQQPMERNIKGLLCSLLYQLLRNTPHRLLQSLHLPRLSDIRSKNSHSDWSVKDLKTVLSPAFKNNTSSVLIVLDSPDECDPSDGPFTLLDLIHD
ncbi:hypothetical protein CONLIGDRAFT_266506 [Coniochaeta ligniaria NRRL 30616]|uniref:Nephrocystin 3-like N-terminal domain-containing protein n=1 Tax=Coniochaeta ligniaria NRRL 30616 TaxID=1408157 RepID=A0A1J7JSJ6_9PEZI|nr:hypothetical protein CONLIGDRAFT_266506 [Coniochaeta ligniaria NRRL 30616]